MVRKKSDYVLLLISIFSILFGVLSLIGDVMKIIGFLSEGTNELIRHFSTNYMEFVGIASYFVQTFVGVRLLYVFVKKGTNKHTQIVVGIIFASIISQAITPIYELFYEVIYLFVSHGSFANLVNAIFNKNGLDLLMVIISIAVSIFVFRAAHRKKMKTEFSLSILFALFWMYFTSYNVYQAFFASDGIKISDAIMSSLTFIINALMIVFYIVKLVEVSKEPNNETFLDYFSDADYSIVKERDKTYKIRLFTTRVENGKKDRIIRFFMVIASLLSIVSLAIFFLMNIDDFLIIKDMSEFSFASLDNVMSLFFSIGYIITIPYGFIFIYGCIKGNANYYRYVNYILCIGTMLSFQALFHYIFLIPNLFSNLDIGTIIGIATLVIYQVVNIIISSKIKEISNDINESDFKGKPYYDDDKDRFVLTIYQSIYSLIGLVLYAVMYFTSKRTPNISIFICFVSTALLFAMLLLNFKNRSNEYFSTTIDKAVLVQYEENKAKEEEEKRKEEETALMAAMTLTNKKDEISNKEEEKSVEEIPTTTIPEKEEKLNDEEIILNIKDDLKNIKHKTLLDFINPRMILKNPFFYLFIILVTALVFCFFFFVKKANEGRDIIYTLAASGVGFIVSVSLFIQILNLISKVTINSNGEMGANFNMYIYLHFLEKHLKNKKRKTKEVLEEIEKRIKKNEKDALTSWAKASELTNKYKKYWSN